VNETQHLLAKAFLEAHPEDAVRIVEELSPSEAAGLLEETSGAVAAAVLSRMDSFQALACLQAMSHKAIGGVLESLDLETLAALLRRLPADAREGLWADLDTERAEAVGILLEYPNDTVGSVMNPLVLSLPDDITVEQAVARIRSRPRQLYYYLYVTDRDRVVAGVLDLRELMLAPAGSLVRDVMHPDVMSVPAHANLASVREHPGWQDFDALPVVNDRNLLVGVVRHRLLRQIDQRDGGARNPQQGLETLIALGELYWAGLCGILGGSVPAPPGQTAPMESKGEQDDA
jgi:magnesium transporter